MGLVGYIDENCVVTLEAGDKEAVLKELTDALVKAGKIDKPDVALSALTEREALGSTGVGEQVAIPHAKLKNLDDMAILIGISRTGIGFGACDGEPVRLFFLLLAPEKQMNLHLKTLARISRLVKLTEFKNKVLADNITSADVCAILEEEEAKL
ncbi:putative PTS IIA-like nitrogen-regulatory protein PtsN [Denitrovibrio acetiphilus DSM 12809]|uniref:Putative PTS IIA-like nitrogen-regulatory protein PtsN n=1 Tax=Denitrovibrio acetiphilus (strain DSM 12809 / NBRC 114555 / N2460) TaxID=522772 RepID=D4H7T4_DENA2|nr:PTS sugar transporter subunit IIA [Denitrovibrio acetiphilus]ADD68083.1 putative PTS IIA-like nitrogen-regulatory protein PtsN [Denitrovibrio acetiphilus DSM 12809]